MSQGNRNKNENKQMGPNQTWKLLYSKGNRKWNEKATQGLREILASDTIDKGLIYKIDKQLIQLSNNNNNNKPQTIQWRNGQKT